ncbi:MAG TPA: hypothetical protein VHE35_12335, partial [Kofleriaceae bacterium]|nr:hypothetical protein [Kofleriaceae bacterium]
PAPPADQGEEFTAEAKLLFRVGACGDDGPVPAPLDPAIVAAHCAVLAKGVQAYEQRYLAVARPYLAALRPADLPKVVVYPFGGGDLLSALTAFPDATELTLISLEYAGDPRRLATLTSPRRQQAALDNFDDSIRWLLRGNWERSRQMKRTQLGPIPGELTYALVALAVHGFEPTSLRYFTLAADGSIHYLTAGERAALDGTRANYLDKEWQRPDFSPAFRNMELRFRPRGGGAERVFRHIGFNLDDRHLTDDPSLLRHLEAKGMVAAMTRAADFLLWGRNFSILRDYLTSHLVWMISDSTGIPPPFAARAGLEQLTYGTFAGAFEPSDQDPRREWNRAFVDLWQQHPPVALPFRFGYPDRRGSAHLLVTRRAPASSP